MTEAHTDAVPGINIPSFIALVAEQVEEAVERFESTSKAPSLFLNELQLQIAFTAEESATRGAKLELKPYFFSVGGEAKKDDREAIVHTVTLNLAVSERPTEAPASSPLENESPIEQSTSTGAGAAELFTAAQNSFYLNAIPFAPTVGLPGLAVGEDTQMQKILSGEIAMEDLLPAEEARRSVSFLIEESNKNFARGSVSDAMLQFGAAETILAGQTVQEIQRQQHGDQGQS